jgi:hypothetical protein
MTAAQVAEQFGLPDWPRLMSEPVAAKYLSIGTTTLREHGPAPKRQGKRRLYDRRDLDRWADRLGGQPLDAREQQEEAKEVERRFLESRGG